MPKQHQEFAKLNHQRIFYIQPKQIKSKFNLIEIAGDDFHHLVNVLRLRVGEQVICKTHEGLNYFCTLQMIKPSLAILKIDKISQKTMPNLPQRPVGVFLCVPRPNVLASIVAKLTEVGVDFLQLVFSERSFFKTPTKLNLLRYEKIVLETLKQCSRNTPLELKQPLHLKNLQPDFSSFLPTTTNSQQTTAINQQSTPPHFPITKNSVKIHKILLWECETNNNLLMNHSREANTPLDPIFIFIGPEGGISHLERNHLQKLGFKSKSISQNILKVETALLLALGKIL